MDATEPDSPKSPSDPFPLTIVEEPVTLDDELLEETPDDDDLPDVPYPYWKEGHLKKASRDLLKSYASRHFVLYSYDATKPATLHWYEDERMQERYPGRFKQFILGNSIVKVTNEKKFQFEISNPEEEKSLQLRADTMADMESWVTAVALEGKKGKMGGEEGAYALRKGPLKFRKSTSLFSFTSESWLDRYLNITTDNASYAGKLIVYKNPEVAHLDSTDTMDEIELDGFEISVYHKRSHSFEMAHAQRGSHVFSANDSRSCMDWMEALKLEAAKPIPPKTKNESSSFKMLASTLKEMTAGMGGWTPGEITLGLAVVGRVHTRRKLEQIFISDILKKETLIHAVFFCKHAWASYETTVENWEALSGLNRDTLVAANWTAGQCRPAYNIAIDTRVKGVIMGIRGTDSIKDALTDLHGAEDPFKVGTAHRGMLMSARWFYKNVRDVLIHQMQIHQGYKLYLVGHSLGGGTASLLAMMLRSDFKHNLHCWGFASAACASPENALYCESYITTFVNRDDVVPRFSTANMEALRAEVLEYPWWEEVREEFKNSKAGQMVENMAPTVEKFAKNAHNKLEKLGVYSKVLNFRDRMESKTDDAGAKALSFLHKKLTRSSSNPDDRSEADSEDPTVTADHKGALLFLDQNFSDEDEYDSDDEVESGTFASTVFESQVPRGLSKTTKPTGALPLPTILEPEGDSSAEPTPRKSALSVDVAPPLDRRASSVADIFGLGSSQKRGSGKFSLSSPGASSRTSRTSKKVRGLSGPAPSLNSLRPVGFLLPPGRCIHLSDDVDRDRKGKTAVRVVRSIHFDNIVLSTSMVGDHLLYQYQRRLEELSGVKMDDIDEALEALQAAQAAEKTASLLPMGEGKIPDQEVDAPKLFDEDYQGVLFTGEDEAEYSEYVAARAS